MLRKILSILLVTVLLFPLGMSLIHAVHEHENQICLAESESHIHKESIDCDHLHYFSQSLGDSFFEEEGSSLNYIFAESNFYVIESPYVKLNSSNSDRAPPVFMIV
ncbi:hypothetical protein [Lutimonas zeaxanthinifaciens]|uniref:hypothetical protein n=1 Tax=Lutimonas zeaxanthinifaciens TaxID=3060215 RepID=UPI00265D5111|nr:hypothetical protein [Lutimonas sp. YSD2104]WKK64816.1 hypothetical protein QZH61_09485 [Lutimonas sp. YSD2104]